MESASSALLVLFVSLLQVRTALLFTAAQANGESVVVAVYNMSAPAGSKAVLQCQSQRMVWTQDGLSDRQRVVHWDLYPPGRDYKVERVCDMFSAGDQRLYNSNNQGRVSMLPSAFTEGNFSLIIRDVGPGDKGIYSCNLHHHYCHLYESTKIQLNLTKSDPPVVESPRVINVILPEHRAHFLQQLGYILATLLFLALVAMAIVLLTRRHRKRGLEYNVRKSEARQVCSNDFVMDATELKACNNEEIRLDYKNNILKERAELSKLPPPKVIDLDKEVEKVSWK